MIGEAFKAAPILTNAAMGAGYAMGNTDVLKHPKEAIAEGLGGAALGAGTAKVMDKIFPSAESLEEFANKKAVQSTNVPPGYLENLKPEEFEDVGKFARESGLVGTDKEEMLGNALAKQKEIGSTIGKIGKEVKGGLDVRDKVTSLYPLMQKAKEYGALANPEAKSLARSYKAGIEDILNLGDEPSWSAVQKLKQQYGDLAFKSTGEVKDEAAKDVYFSLRDMLKTMADRAQGNPGLPQEYKQALMQYHQIDPIVEGFKTEVGLERAGKAGHSVGHGFIPRIIRSLPGQNNPTVNLGTAAAATMVAPHLGPIMALPTLINPAVQSKAAAGIAKALPGLQQGASDAIENYLASKFAEQ